MRDILSETESLLYFHTKHLWHPFYFENGMLLLLVIIFSLFVIIATNPIHSILFLVLVFLITSIVFIYSGAFFLGMVLVIVYLGAVCVLFLFVIMMLNIKVLELKRKINFLPYLFVLFLVFYLVRLKGVKANLFEDPRTGDSGDNFIESEFIHSLKLDYKAVLLLISDEESFDLKKQLKYIKLFSLKFDKLDFKFLDIKFKVFEIFSDKLFKNVLITENSYNGLNCNEFIDSIIIDKNVSNLNYFINILKISKFYDISKFVYVQQVLELGKKLVYDADVKHQINPLLSMKRLGIILYSFCVLQFISAGIVLLIAMIGSIFLTLELNKGSKKQFFFSQINRIKYKI